MKLTLTFILIFSALCAFANSLPKSDQQLELEDFIKQAKSNDPQFQSIIADRLKSKYLVDLNLPSRELLLSIQNEYGFARNESSSSSLSAVISKPLLETGTVLSVGKIMTERPDRTEDVTQMRLEQSLYRNAFGKQVRDKIEVLDKQKSLIELQVVEAYEDYIQQVIHTYLDLTLSYLNYQTAERLQKDTQELLKNVLNRKKKNIASSTDVNRAELQNSQREENKLQSLVNLETQSRGILRILGEEKARIFIPTTDLSLENRLSSTEIDIEAFLLASRSRAIYDKQEAVTAGNLKLAKENLKPSANLLLGFNIDNSRRFTTPIEREELVVGVKIDIPFGNSVVEAQIEEASYNLLKSKLEKKSFDNAIKESLYVIKNRIQRQKEQLKISKRKRDLAVKIVSDQNKRYQVGRVTLENFIEDRNLQALYEFAYLSEQTILNKLIIQWLALTDQLIDKTEEKSI